MNNIDDMFEGEPLEHLVKILQNASPQAIRNTFEALFEEHAILSIALEQNLTENAKEIKANYKDEIQLAKQDLAIRLMADILSQE